MGILKLKSNLQNMNKIYKFNSNVLTINPEYIYSNRIKYKIKKNFLKIETNKIFIDFSKIYYYILYKDTCMKNINDYIFLIKEYLDKYSGKKIILFIDKGVINQKKKLREIREKSILNYTEKLDKKINLNKDYNNLDAVERLEFKKLCMNNKTEIISGILDNLSESYELIYCNKIDAEYVMAQETVKYYNENKKVPLLDCDDQDLILLLLTNLKMDFVINNEFYINDNLSKNIAKLTLFLNKSDYLEGIHQISCCLKINELKIEDFSEKKNIFKLLKIYINNYKKVKCDQDFDIEEICKKIKIYLHKFNSYFNIFGQNIYDFDLIDVNINKKELIYFLSSELI